jgi:nucleotide-binding universal stress UspA family protein
MSTFKHILVPLDWGEPSRRALELAIELVQTFGAELSVVHVYEIPAYAYGGMPPVAADLVTPIERAARKELDQEIAAIRRRVPDAHAVLRSGGAWREILAAIEETHADLVVMGTHGRRGVPRFLLGSVAEKVVRMSPIPVLTVRAAE